jgi:two-component system sensor histidine kinase UhpB
VARGIGFNRIFGYSEQEMDSSIAWWEERLHPDDRERVLSAYQETVASGGHTCSYEYRFRRKDDTYAVVNDHAYIVRNPGGKPVRALGAMTDITERKAAETALRDYSKRLQTLSRRLIDAQERERAVIARELHDQTGQVLSVLKLTLQIARRDARARQVAPHLDEALQHIDTALQQVRTLSYSLRPPQLDDLGLVAALRNYADRIAGAAGLKLHYDIQAPPRLAGQSAIACFRVAQEAITNVVRHAAAKTLWIALACDDELRLEVRDDGRGCDMPEVRRRALRGDSMGVVNMEERTLLGGGRIDIDSSPGNGTVVRASFPLYVEEPAQPADEVI